MKWQDVAVEDLKKYEWQKEGLASLAERLEILRLRYESVRVSRTDGVPVRGGAGRVEDTLLDNIVERQRLELMLEANRRLVELIDRGLGALSENERMVLDAFFIHKRKNHVGWLCEELGYEQAQIYRLKDEALYRFTMAQYGVTEF